MSGPENFLSRWSRRKRTADEPQEKPVADPSALRDDARSTVPVPNDRRNDSPAAVQPVRADVAPEPAFDPESLPPIDSIGAQTDISAFLKPGVPSELRLAALRRAWSADPAIRDFVGLQENDWDFNDPTGVLGFGELSPGTDIKKMLGRLFDEPPSAAEADAKLPAPADQLNAASRELSLPAEDAAREAADESTPEAETSDPQRLLETERDELVQRKKDIATQDDDRDSCNAQIKHRRSQGSALPQ